MSEIERALDDVAGALVWPDPSIDVTSRAVARLAPRRRSRRWAVAAIVAVVAVGAGVPAAAHLLDVRGVRVTRSGAVPPGLAGDLDLGAPVEVPDDVAVPKGIGRPAAAFAGRPSGGLTLVWAPSDRLPEVRDLGVGLVLTRFRGRVGRPLLEKRVYDGGTLEATTVDGAPAYWLGGAPHGFLYVDPSGQPVEDTLRLSGHALLWTRDGWTYRMESSLSLAASRALAASMSA
jgi:hypothetical protein